MLIYYNNPKLRIASIPVQEINDTVEKLALDLIDIQTKAGGVGLAAPQVGVNLRVFVIGKQPFINPQILSHTEETLIQPEGCLSLPGISVDVKRYQEIEVSYLDINTAQETKAVLTGLEAVIFQHELDHLNGRLIIDYLSPINRSFIDKKLKKIHNAFNS